MYDGFGLGRSVETKRKSLWCQRWITLRSMRILLLPTEQEAGSHYEIVTNWSAKAGSGGVMWDTRLQLGARLQANGPSSDITESISKFCSAKSIGTELSLRMVGS